MTDFYKMDPGAWDHGTANLSLEEEAAYLRLVNAIHKNKSPVPDNVRVWAGLFRSSTRKAQALVDALIEAGKITRTEDGLINERAVSDLVRRGFVSVSRSESGAKGGRTRAENAANALKDNNAPQANASTRGEESREEYSDAIASDAEGVDFAAVIFDRGVKFLVGKGTPERQARSVIGKWRKDHHDRDIFDAFAAASKEGVVDPVPWITARLTPPPTNVIDVRAIMEGRA